MYRITRLRKTFGPLSAGTAVEVTREAGPEGYCTIQLVHISKAFRENVEHHKVYHQLLKPWDIEADMLVHPRPKVEA